MLNDSRIAFIGSGAMAEAMISGLLNKGMAQPSNLIASGPREERGQRLRELYKVRTTTDNAQAAHEADIVVLSVKPQVLRWVFYSQRAQRVGLPGGRCFVFRP
ncbi:MAG: NAD(P)-binding domain-containing protein [Bacteroidia bacterium]|nr:NAD(P)-binding domain-containing protein [Bacteroidia bacterium]